MHNRNKGGVVKMYQNLLCEMKLNKISNIDISNLLGIHRNTVKKKIFEEGTRFKMEEVSKIQEKFFPYLTTDYLFKTVKKEEKSGQRI